MNEALQGISSEVQQLLWQMQTEVVMEAIRELKSARLPPGSYNSYFRQGSTVGVDDVPILQESGPSGKSVKSVSDTTLQLKGWSPLPDLLAHMFFCATT